ARGTGDGLAEPRVERTVAREPEREGAPGMRDLGQNLEQPGEAGIRPGEHLVTAETDRARDVAGLALAVDDLERLVDRADEPGIRAPLRADGRRQHLAAR